MVKTRYYTKLYHKLSLWLKGKSFKCSKEIIKKWYSEILSSKGTSYLCMSNINEFQKHVEWKKLDTNSTYYTMPRYDVQEQAKWIYGGGIIFLVGWWGIGWREWEISYLKLWCGSSSCTLKIVYFILGKLATT